MNCILLLVFIIMAAIVGEHEEAGGYNCEPVDAKEAASYICGICNKILRDPVSVTCCSASSYFCKSCLSKNPMSCSTCGRQLRAQHESHYSTRYAGYSTSHYYGSRFESYDPWQTYYHSNPRSNIADDIDKIEVYCSNKAKGCKWRGALKQMPNHLNINPSAETATNGCKYSEVKCPHCSESISRPAINTHMTRKCQFRPYNCKYCDYKSNYDDVTKTHSPQCDMRPVECPEKCGETIFFCELRQHCDDVCPKKMIACKFDYCYKTLPRKAIPAHVLTEHVDQLTECNNDNTVIRKLDEVQECLSELQSEVEQLKLAQASVIASPPIQFKMYNFDGLKGTNREWFSTPYFTYPKGYKMCLNVDANGYGDGKDTHVSVFVYLMQGDFDSDLKWPFQGDIVVQLLDQTGEGDDHEKTVHFTKNTAENTAGRVLNKERADSAAGIHKFIAHADIKPKYLKDGCLQLKVVSATVFSL